MFLRTARGEHFGWALLSLSLALLGCPTPPVDCASGELNACGGCAELPAEPGTSCGAGHTWACTGTGRISCVGSDAGAACASPNACGGCVELPATPGESCGPAGYVWACSGTGHILCMGADAGSSSDAGTCSSPNACGGCIELPATPGEACGPAGYVWACSGTGLTCVGTDAGVCGGGSLNACGGCAELPANPGDACGPAGYVWSCAGLGRLTCTPSADAGVCAGGAINACGGCAELPARPGDACGPPGYVWNCTGSRLTCATSADAGTCASGVVNACGGCGALPAQVGQSCGPAGYTWACEGQAFTCHLSFAPATALVASQDLELVVHLSWSPPIGMAPTGYVVLRDGTEVASIDAGVTSHDDATAPAGRVLAPTGLSASNGTRVDGVELSWQAPTSLSGRASAYTVVAVYGAQRSGPSTVAVGLRAAPVVTAYEVSRDDGQTWAPLSSTATSFIDGDAGVGVITATARATADVFRGVALLAIDETRPLTVGDAPAATYRVRASSVVGASSPSPSAVGARKTDTRVAFQWQRCATQDAGVDAGLDCVDLPNVTGATWFDEAAGRGPSTYRAMMSSRSAVGASSPATTTVAGVVTIVSDRYHGVGLEPFCVITTTGQLTCYQSNLEGRAWPADATAVWWEPGYDTCVTTRAGVVDCVRGAFGLGSGFKSVALQTTNRCGVRFDGGLQCTDAGTAPAGPSTTPYKEVSSGNSGFCALGVDNRLTCWFAGGVTTTSTNTFTALSGACGLRSDGLVECFSATGSTVTTTAYRALSVAQSSTAPVCGIRMDGTAECPLGAAPTVDSFDRVVVVGHTGGWDYCGVRPNGRVLCWGTRPGAAPNDLPFSESVEAVSVGTHHACAALTDGGTRCVGENTYGQAVFSPDAGALVQISAGDRHTCGLRRDGSGVCWGRHGLAGAPALASAGGPYTRLTAQAEGRNCLVRADGGFGCTALSWPIPPFCQPATYYLCHEYQGSLASTAIDGEGGFNTMCMIRADGHLVCNQRVFLPTTSAPFPMDPTVDAYQRLEFNGSRLCAQMASGRVDCWTGTSGQPSVLNTQWRDFALSTTGVCGLTADGRLECPGRAPVFNRFDTYKSVATQSFGAGICAVREDGKGICEGQL